MYNGKAIYNPSGKAGEYSYWACNFYVGCSNGCEYCYCKKGIMSGSIGQDKPQLKKCFSDDDHALETLKKEIALNRDELKHHGLFFSFTTDPMLPETLDLTLRAIDVCLGNGIPVKILTKCTDWLGIFNPDYYRHYECKIAFGFTLTGHDELEPGAAKNYQRIEAMRILHSKRFRTFASVEPVIDFESSVTMIDAAEKHCDLFKIGLLSGKKYEIGLLKYFIDIISQTVDSKIYFKDHLLKLAGVSRESLPSNCVTRDYDLFGYL